MARQNATNFTGPLQFPYATAGTDLFKKEDVQVLAQAVDQHNHTSGKGTLLPSTALSWPVTAPNGATIDGPVANPNRVVLSNDLYVKSDGTGTITSGPITANGSILSTNSQLFLGDTTTGIARSGGNTIYGGGGHYFWQSLSGTPSDIYAAAVHASVIGGTLGGTTLLLNDGSNGVISTGAGGLFLRANNGIVMIDGALGLRVGTSAYTVTGGDIGVSRNSTPATGAIYFGSGGAGYINYDTTGTFIVSTPMRVLGELSATQFTWAAGTHYYAKSGPNILQIASGGGFYMWTSTAGAYGTVYAAVFSVQSALVGKAEVRAIDNPMAIVRDPTLHGVTYNDVTQETPVPRVGFVADAWYPVVPEVVTLNSDGEPQGMAYPDVGAITFEALKQYASETDARLEALEARLPA